MNLLSREKPLNLPWTCCLLTFYISRTWLNKITWWRPFLLQFASTSQFPQHFHSLGYTSCKYISPVRFETRLSILAIHKGKITNTEINKYELKLKGKPENTTIRKTAKNRGEKEITYKICAALRNWQKLNSSKQLQRF